MHYNLKSAILFIGVAMSFSTLSSQDLFVGSGSNLYLGTGSSVAAFGNVVSEENITGATTGRLALVGGVNTTLDMNNNSVHGLDIQKNTGNTVTLTDSFSTNNLYLSSGKLLLGAFTGKVNANMDNNATGIINSQGTGSLKFNYTSANSDTLFLDQGTLGTSNQLVDFYVRGNANMSLGDMVNIKRLAYIGSSSTLASNASTPYIKMVATDSTHYGQLQFEQGAILTGKGTSEMVNNHSATYIHIGTPYTGSTYAELSDDVTIFFNASGGKPKQWNIFTYNENLTTKVPGIGQNSFWNAVNAESDAMARGRGHALYTWAPGTAGVSLPAAYPNTIDVSGTFTTSTFSQNATRTTSAFGFQQDSTGYHIVANPYYCNIKVPTLDTAVQGQAFYRYKSYGNGTYQYIGYNTNTGTSLNGGSQYVAPMQAIYYQVSSPASINFTPAWQESTPSNSTNQWKSSPVSDEIRLTVKSNSNKNTDEAIVGFMGTAKDGFANEDSRKVNNGYTYPNIYTYSDDNRVSYNYLNSVKEGTVIPVGFSAYYNGSYTISAENESQTEVNNIVLEDKKNGTFTELTSGGNYTFDHDSKNEAGRFVLHLKKNPTSGIADVKTNSYYVYAADNNISVKFATASNENITVNIYDMLGREMTSGFEGKVSTEQLDFSTSGWSPAYYLVNIKTAKETKTIKVLVK